MSLLLSNWCCHALNKAIADLDIILSSSVKLLVKASRPITRMISKSVDLNRSLLQIYLDSANQCDQSLGRSDRLSVQCEVFICHVS